MASIPNRRWCLYIDIEGFGKLYDQGTLALLGLRELMKGTFRIGSICYSTSPNRIFAHQTGDGFAIISEFPASELDVPIAIGVALLRHVAASGTFAKASLGEGDFADITSCYPKEVLDARDTDGVVIMGESVMTLFPVMGTALIDAIGVQKDSHGSLFCTAIENGSRIAGANGDHLAQVDGRISVDWVHLDLPLISQIQVKAGLSAPSGADIETKFWRYVENQNLQGEWVENTRRICHLERVRSSR